MAPKACAFPGCQKIARGALCKSHYSQRYRQTPLRPINKQGPRALVEDPKRPEVALAVEHWNQSVEENTEAP
jgi:hypothetical protein